MKRTCCCAQAHFINNRTMEVFRQLRWETGAPDGACAGARDAEPGSGSGQGGSLADAVAAGSPPLEQWRRFLYCESALGRVLGETDHFEVGHTSKIEHLSSACSIRGALS